VSNQHKETVQAATPSSVRELRITRVFDAPRKLLFEAWTDPQHLVHWWGPRGFTTPKCVMNPHAGGSYEFLMRASDGSEVRWFGVCREIVEPERLVWSATIRDTKGNLVSRETILTVTLEEQEGKTKLTLHQGIFDSDDDLEAHRNGWNEALDRTAEHLASL